MRKRESKYLIGMMKKGKRTKMIQVKKRRQWMHAVGDSFYSMYIQKSPKVDPSIEEIIWSQHPLIAVMIDVAGTIETSVSVENG